MKRAHWREALSVAALLGVAPEQFWRLSVLEWRALISGLGATGPAMRRDEFDSLLGQYPDKGISSNG